MNIALIPARSGSKGVPGKNIKLLGGHPLIAYSIAIARTCSRIDQVIVSTDSDEIAGIARRYGAETPFKRPKIYSDDGSTACDVVSHFLGWYKENHGILPDLVTMLLPTTPLRDPVAVDYCVCLMNEYPDSTSLRSVHKLAEPPQKMMRIENGYLTGFFPGTYSDPEYWNWPRQGFHQAYHPNGYAEIIRPGILINSTRKTMFGDRILPYITEHVVEIDQPEDFEHLEYIIEKKGHVTRDLLGSLKA